MLLPSPILLHRLLRQYDSLLGQDSPAARRELADVTYTLCVSTATRTIEDALVVARTLTEAVPAPQPAEQEEEAAPAPALAAIG